MRSDFVANVSHELRTPLTVIIGYLSHFLSLETNEEQHDKAFRQMFTQASRMERLIKDLLMLSRLETLPEITRLQDIELLPALQMIREEIVAAFANQRSIDIDCDTSLRLKGNWDELRSAFTNLVMNAAKYTDAGGHIQVRWFANGDHAFFEVEDDGIGIENQHLSRLTERFYRVDKGRSIDTGGTGLGLAIVKHVLIRHHAELIIQSTPGQGSLFRCVFPLSQTAIEKPVDRVLS
jgi:two-component system phosphate regulon sensor histidine kinase PhoR